MASAAGGSGLGGDDHCPSGGKSKTPVGPHVRSKKPGAFERAALRYLEKEYRECVARGKEPPFDLEDMLRHYGPSPPNPEVAAPLSSSALAKKSIRAFYFPTQGRLKTYVVRIFVFVFEWNLYMWC